MPHISVIIDNYNYASFLGQALDSVLAQSFSDFECLVVDDGSDDNSIEIIEQYTRIDKRVRSVLKKNGGQTSAFSAGFARASGEIVAFLDSDDFWYPQKLEHIVAAHRSNRIVQHYLAPNGQGIYRKIREDLNRRDALLTYGYMYNHSPCSALSFTKECIAPFFPLQQPERMRGYSDGCLLMLAMTRAEVCVLPDVLGYYRIHGKNMHVDKTDKGPKSRKIFQAQREYVNLQLRHRGFSEIPFSDTAYIASRLTRHASTLHKKKHLFVYGTEAAGKSVTTVLVDMGLSVFAYVDSDAAKWGQDFSGKAVLSPNQLGEFTDVDMGVIIASSAVQPITETLYTLGIDDDHILVLDI